MIMYQDLPSGPSRFDTGSDTDSEFGGDFERAANGSQGGGGGSAFRRGGALAPSVSEERILWQMGSAGSVDGLLDEVELSPCACVYLAENAALKAADLLEIWAAKKRGGGHPRVYAADLMRLFLDKKTSAKNV